MDGASENKESDFEFKALGRHGRNRFRQQTFNQTSSGLNDFTDASLEVGHEGRHGSQRVLFAERDKLQSAWSFGSFFIGLRAITVIMTPFFNASRGSLLIASLYHLHMMNPIFPDAQPWDNFLFAIAAVTIVFLNRHQMFQRGSGVTEVFGSEWKE